MANFSPQGQAEFDAKVDKFKQDLLREADRIEAASNTGGQQEITPQHVTQAEFLVRQGLMRVPKSGLDFIPVIATPAAGILGGWATNNLKSGWGVLAVIAAIVVIFISEVYKHNKDSR
ncbi:hypothetical protein ACQP06_32685 [Nocardia sp. CA-136227]|uniref:hypothetical protein n=1 Tax=Nocardia sp. CA-136227 TaxID=3239979 RepID=UPI003D98A500